LLLAKISQKLTLNVEIYFTQVKEEEVTGVIKVRPSSVTNVLQPWETQRLLIIWD
jgi:hypothetical protein